ncbi:MAG: efflux RND transporter periplasmic adaptor subunit [Planctomycetota bacterium]|jgi:RND family efflux transporter MFP subunit
MKFKKTFLYSIVFCAVISLASAVSPAAESYLSDSIAAITAPSKDVTVSFLRPGRISQVYVKAGQKVRVGQPIVQQDDAAQQIQLSILKADSQDRSQILADQAKLDQKKVDLKKIEWAAKRGSATDLEVEHAKLDVTISQLSLKVAQFEHEQSQKRYEEAKITVDRMRMKSPTTGYVEQLFIEAGESVNGLDEVIRIVKIDPLWVDVPVPLNKAKNLKLEQAVKIKFSLDNQLTTDAKIIYIAAVSDAASGTLTVRIEVPNSARRQAGEHVSVIF